MRTIFTVEQLATELALRGALVFLFIGCAAALALGLWLLARPESLPRLNERWSRWVSTRQALRPLMVPLRSEPFIYRHHRVTGALVLAASGWLVYALLARIEIGALVALFSPPYRRALVEWLVQSAWIFLLLAAVAGAAIGIVMFLRPSLLKGIEAWANRRYSTRRGLRFAEVMHHHPDRAASRHPRLTAALIVLGSLSALYGLGRLLFF